jgi:3-hydroxyisobutyrate dehydrogenase
MCNQIALASTLMGVAESMAYARSAGLQGAAVLEALGPGAAGSFQLAMLGPKMIAQDFAPGFMLKHFIKDLGIALAEAEAMGQSLPGLAQVKRLAEMAAATAGPDAGTQAIIAALTVS